MNARVVLFTQIVSTVARPCDVVAQSADTLIGDSVDLERVLEESTREEEDSNLMDILTDLAEHPLNLNDAGIEELQRIPGVDGPLAFRILEYRRKKIFQTVDELSRVEGMTKELVDRIRPFLIADQVRSSNFPSGVLVSLRSRAGRDLQRRRGFLDGSYRGSPLKYFNRVLIRSNWSDGNLLKEYSAGLVMEKDPGERRINSFVASSLSLTLAPVPLQIIVGDYVAETGQGLVVAGGGDFSRGSDGVTPGRRNGPGIRAYFSTDESSFLRGGALTANIGWLSASFIYSNKALNGTLDEKGEILSLSTGGLFRTDTERLKRNISRERLAGILIGGNPCDEFRFTLVGFHAKYLHPIAIGGLRGVREMLVTGINGSWTRSLFSIFGEIANDRRSIACSGGVTVRPSSGISIIAAGRWYPAQFENLHGHGFGESGGILKNEFGFYTAASLILTPWCTLLASYDQFAFRGKTSASDFPSSGNESILRGDLRVSKTITFEIRYKEQNKPALLTEADPLMRLMEVTGLRSQKNYRGTFELRPSSALRWRSRVEIVHVSYPLAHSGELGTLIFQDLGILAVKGLHLNARLVIFDTDSFDSRIYEFENDVRGAFLNPALFGKGIRYYVVARFELAAGMKIEMKYAATMKEGVRAIGTGPALIDGDTESRVTVQCDVIF